MCRAVKMKILTLLFLSLSINTVFAQDIFTTVRPMLKSGDAHQLSAYFNSTIDVTIGNNKSPYSKAQAELVLRDFFKANPPADFTIMHTGSSKAGLKFAIGQYKSGKTAYSVLIRIRENEKNWLIHEISFVRE